MANTDDAPLEHSTRICTHMNEDHAATIHAIVLGTLTRSESHRCKVQNAKMKSISLQGYTLAYILCDGDACAMKEVIIPFDPPLQSAAEAKSRLVKDHHAALIPKFSWLVSDPLMRTLFGACLLLGAGTAIGHDELVQRINGNHYASSIVTTIYGTSDSFASLVIFFFYFSLVAHSMEAVYTAYLCKQKLKMKNGTTLRWIALNVCTGFPIMNKVKELVKVDAAARSEKKR
mmetsp:Transcript_40644/g.85375  ORF Transcript_40644/g.85375 Transcript_40644/m.85375 type:complete len:231 (+) Transcript_40644:133-825(+)